MNHRRLEELVRAILNAYNRALEGADPTSEAMRAACRELDRQRLEARRPPNDHTARALWNAWGGPR